MQTKIFNHNIEKGAVISACNQYRYRLWRIWDAAKPMVLFIMLNPSTANANQDDPTIRRCMGFAKSWGYGGVYVGNLFAYRATQPKGLLEPTDPIGKENNIHLTNMSTACKLAVCAWGNAPIIKKLGLKHNPLEGINIPLHYIELAKDGTPKHPLNLKKSIKHREFGVGHSSPKCT